MPINIQKWSKFVDIVTIIWLCIFGIGYFSKGEIANICSLLNIAILSVFLTDLALLYRKSGGWHLFLRGNWFDILMIIPYFRVFRIFRVFRVIRLLKFTKIAKVTKIKSSINPLKILRIAHETSDIIRSIKKRMFQKD